MNYELPKDMRLAKKDEEEMDDFLMGFIKGNLRGMILGIAFIILVLLILVVKPVDSIVELEPDTIKTDYTIKQIIENAAREVANSHEYKLHVFDCTDFSEELVMRLKHFGFDAYCVFGKHKTSDYPLHTWVEVEINGEVIPVESTAGSIISPENYKENYLIKSKRKCV